LDESLLETRFNVTHRLATKFTSCLVYFYFQDEIIEYLHWIPSHQALISSFNPTVLVREENPVAIVMITVHKLSVETRRYEYFYLLSVTSTFYIIVEQSNAYILCTLCQENIQLFPIFGPSDLSESNWRKIHTTSGARIPINMGAAHGYNYWGEDQPECLHFAFRASSPDLFPLAEHCLLILMNPFLNLTGKNAGPYDFPRGISAFRLLMMPQNVYDFFLDIFEERKYIATPYMMTESGFTFGTLVKPQKRGVEALMQPFDLSTWIAILISTMVLAVYMQIMSNKMQRYSLVTNIFSILLEQGQDAGGTRLNFSTTTTLYIVSMWLLMTIVISNGYKGVLFTLLTTNVLPWTPKTLAEAADSQLFLTTVSGHGQVLSFETPVSIALTQISNVLGRIDQGKIETQNKAAFRKFKDSLAFIDTAKQYSLFRNIGKNFQMANGTNVSIPTDGIILFDSEQEVNIFENLHELYTNKVVRRGEKVELMSERTQWMTERNAFLRLAYPFVQGVYESGVYNKWDYYFWTAQYYWIMKQIKEESLTEVTEEKVSEKALLTYLLFKPFPISLTSAPESIYMMEFSLFMILLVYCIGFSTVIIFLEFGWHFRIYRISIYGEKGVKWVKQFIFNLDLRNSMNILRWKYS